MNKNIFPIDLSKAFNIYIIAFAIIMFMYCLAESQIPSGECDDYTFPIASILNDHNFGISSEDIVFFKKLFPTWVNVADNYVISPFTTRSGSGEMVWYFPTYAVLCTPFTVLLYCMEEPTYFAFPLTNLLFLICSLVFVFKYLKVSDEKKIILILALSINPIVFYLSWQSAEVIIFAFLVIGLSCWYNKWYKRAALFVSLAGTLNPTTMFVGIVMIFDYIIEIFKRKNNDLNWQECVHNEFLSLVKYGCCYVIGLVPMLYNYYNTGYINLAAPFYKSETLVFPRFLAYLFDLNFGFLPYFTFLITIGAGLLIVALIKHHIKYIIWMAAFLGLVVTYSFMGHINCGMAGIARYNAWAVTILIFSVVIYCDEIVYNKVLLKWLKYAVRIGVAITGSIVLAFSPASAKNTHCQYMSPIAALVLDNAPELYNPLYSTFNSRVNHVDGGYDYESQLPIIYADSEGRVCKILASASNKDELFEKLHSADLNEEWLVNKIESIGEACEYVNIPKKRGVIISKEYYLGTNLLFTYDDNNSSDYIQRGFSAPEDWGTWTDGREALMTFVTYSDCEYINGIINCGVYNNTQDVIICANKEEILYENDFSGGRLNFRFKNPGKGQPILLEITLPDAVSPHEFGYSDSRVLALSVHDMILYEEAEAY